MLPPTVARLRSCTPTMWRSASRTAPWVKASSPGWVSSWRRVTIAPMEKPASVSSIVSSPRPDRSMAVPTLIVSILSQIMPPRMRLAFFWLSCQASSRLSARLYSRIVIMCRSLSFYPCCFYFNTDTDCVSIGDCAIMEKIPSESAGLFYANACFYGVCAHGLWSEYPLWLQQASGTV